MSRKVRKLCEEAKVDAAYDRKAALALVPPIEFGPGRTEQGHVDACDINKIVKKHQIRVARSHADLYPPEYYQDFEGLDLLGYYDIKARADEAFMALPAEVRSEFGNDSMQFAAFASDPANNGRLGELIPAIAEPGAYFPNPVQRGGQGAGAATAHVKPATAVEGVGNPPEGTEGTSESGPAEGA